MGNVTVPNDTYKGKTITSLLNKKGFIMVESSGETGNYSTEEIRHELGLDI